MSKPDKKFQIGNVHTAIWSREVERGDDTVTLYSVSAQKSYRADDETKFTNSFDQAELPQLARCLQRCQVWIEQQEEVAYATN